MPLSLARCEVTHIDRVPIDADRARAQHDAYVRSLRDEGMAVVELPGDDALPDSVFIEDLLLDLGDVRVLTAPGADSRRPEREALRAAFGPGGVLEAWGPLVEMPDGLRLDGGDVLRVRSDVFVGLSSRTDRSAIAWLDSVTRSRVIPVPVAGALHLKTAASALTENLLVVNPDAVDPAAFGMIDVILCARGEEGAANVLRLPPRRERCTVDDRDERALMPAGNPRTAAAARRWGVQVTEVAIDELEKAEAGVTCMSVLLGADFALDLDALPNERVARVGDSMGDRL